MDLPVLGLIVGGIANYAIHKQDGHIVVSGPNKGGVSPKVIILGSAGGGVGAIVARDLFGFRGTIPAAIGAVVGVFALYHFLSL